MAQIGTWDWGDNSGIFAIFSKIQTLRGMDLSLRYGIFCVTFGLMQTGFMFKKYSNVCRAKLAFILESHNDSK